MNGSEAPGPPVGGVPRDVAIAVRDLSVRYDRNLALDSVSFDIAAGTAVCVL